MEAFFRVHDLSFSFDASSKELFFKEINCSFKKNSLNFIRGKNGAGKSTLFRLLQGKLERNEFLKGTIIMDEKVYQLELADHRTRLKRTIRLAPQKFDGMLADQFNFIENLQLASMPHFPQLEQFHAHITIPHLVDRFGINYTVPVGMLSGGQRQILAILMALQKFAPILLLDEPTAALDDKNASMVMTFLAELLKADTSLTVLIICHDKELVERYADKHYHQIEVHEDNTRTIEPITI